MVRKRESVFQGVKGRSESSGVRGHKLTYLLFFPFPHSLPHLLTKGYHLLGEERRVCQGNGEWSATAPECRENCKYHCLLL
ncbi:hypothetical protein E2C01_093192 [Portunus trituberculatus]|uniref:Sushi domain-containing protein n=1 Tax=Portunus trituberculatus TaxID=210409 RepID=A0A5B7JTC5_PORTR|nr:hypothetical protein [Portunus trituberculatus]